MPEPSFPSRNVWLLWGAQLSSSFIIGIVLYAIRQTTMKDVQPVIEEPFLRTVRFIAAAVIILLWFIGYALARRTRRIRLIALEQSPSSVLERPEPADTSTTSPAFSSALITWAVFEAGFLVGTVYWFLSLDLVTILPGMILHIGSLLYFNPANLGFMEET